MKTFKFFSVLAVAALLLVPTAAMAKTSFSFSLNLFDTVAPFFAPRPVVMAPRVPVVMAPRVPVVIAPRSPIVCYVPYTPRAPQQRTIVKEYHYYHQLSQEPVNEFHFLAPTQPNFQPCP